MNGMIGDTGKSTVRSCIDVCVLIVSVFAGWSSADAYDLKTNTIYANTSEGLYEINEVAQTAVRVADAKPSLSQIEDIAFDGTTLYGLTFLMQLFKIEPDENDITALNSATSFALHHKGIAIGNGVLYAAETRLLQSVDKSSGVLDNVGAYGLGAGEEVTDLAFAEDGTLYATVSFGLPTDYLGTINPATGEMMLIGNMFISGSRALTLKDNVAYVMNSVGDLYTVNRVNGFGTKIADAVLPGAYGMTTSTANLAIPVSGSGSNTVPASNGGSGSMSAWLLFMLVMFKMVRYLNESRDFSGRGVQM